MAKSIALKLIVILALMACCLFSSKKLVAFAAENNLSDSDQEVLYLPDGRGLNFISFGYKNFLADILWFNTINYFGKHYHSDQKYQWLAHMCDIVTTVDPNPKYVYEFCSNMLSWEANLPQESVKILDKAVIQYPQNWKFPYLRGFTKMFFLKDDGGALADFTAAAKLPGSSWIAARLAAKKIALSDDPKTAIEFLKEMLNGTTDENQKRALEGRLREAQLVSDLDTIDQALSVYRTKNGHAPKTIDDLVSSGVISSLPLDPFGGKYFIDESGKVSSTSTVKLPKFFRRSN